MQRENREFFSTESIFESFKATMDFDDKNMPKWLNPNWIGRMINSLDVGMRGTEIIIGRQKRGYWVDKDRLKDIINRFGVNDAQ